MQPMMQRPKFGQQTPPAMFTPIFGLLGLGLAWRRASVALAVPVELSDMILGAVTLLYVFAVFMYLVKVYRRASVIPEDLRVLPGRAGLAAAVLSIYLVAAAMVPISTGLATVLLWLGLGVHAGLILMMLRLFTIWPAEQRQVTPVWHLTFVGPIIAPLSAVPLGYRGLSETILIVTGLIAGAIWAVSALQLLRRDPPPPLRPLLAIHLAPASLLGTVSLILGHEQLAVGMAAWGGLILAGLLLRARYITAAGFSPMWGAFTFPLAAYASLMLMLAAAGQGRVFEIAGIILLVAATMMIPPIAVKVMKAWAKGALATKTNAARA